MAAHRREQNAAAPRKALIVTSAGTGRSRLSAIAAEAEAINRLALEIHRLDDPTPDEVIAALPEYDVAHFACHSISDPDEPSRSHLLLSGPDGAQLTISDIGGLEIHSALAYLSACETTLPASRLTDEALHLTGAFHLAGFRHVVGSLWSIDDRAAAEIAKEFYGGLGGMPASTLNTDRSAQALNDVCRRQRDLFPKAPSRWAAHIHVGW
jgi:CHAT domain-containing protein